MEQDTRKSVVAAVTQEPLFSQTVPTPAKGRFGKLLQRLGLRPRSRTITIYPPFPSTVFKIAAALLDIKPMRKLTENNVYEVFYELNHDNLEAMLSIVAIASHNGKGKPDPTLPEFISNHFSYADLRRAIEAVHRGLDVENFFAIMASVRSIGISDMLETEAPGPHSEGLSNTTDSDGTK